MYYDPEANIISWEIAQGKIDHAKEIGNFIIHISKSGKPLLIEILNASKFVSQLEKVKIKENLQSLGVIKN